VPKILYETNAKRWRSATLLALPYSEGPLINEDIRKEIFHALSLIQESYKEVNDIHTHEDYELSNLLIKLTPLGEEAAKPVRYEDGDHGCARRNLDCLGFDPQSLEREFNPLNTGIPELDELNKKYDVISLQGGWDLTMVFRKPLILNYAIEDYKRVDKLKFVGRNDTIGEGTGIVLKENEDLWEFIFIRGGRDCPSDPYITDIITFLFDRVMKKITKKEERGDPLHKKTFSVPKGFVKIIDDSQEQEWKPITSGRECTSRLAGHGKRSKGTCSDIISDKMNSRQGPIMVVVPADGEFQSAFAIGKYEISLRDWGKYCELSGICKPITDKTRFYEPMTGITFKEAEQYAKCVSERTGKTYRIPTASEWEYAANAEGNQPRKDFFNCRVVVQDKVYEGTGIVSVKSGKTNGWGLKNYVGNVQEWVITNGGSVMAAGGYYGVDRSLCGIDYIKPHSGAADEYTGFRLLLEMN